MSLAELDDINVHLPDDKIKLQDADDDARQLDAERVVKARLSGTFSPVTLASWSTPNDTPSIIREVAGKLMAAMHYAKKFSSEVVGVPEYAQWLYDQAMETLDGIVLGTIVIPPDELPPDESPDAGQHLTSDMFWPNAETGGPRFGRNDVF